jgi:hypothetical protein
MFQGHFEAQMNPAELAQFTRDLLQDDAWQGYPVEAITADLQVEAS